MNKYWFTLVELIVAITILTILWTLWFISYTRSNTDTRDAVRISDTKALARKIEIDINSNKVNTINEYIEELLPQNTFLTGSVFDSQSWNNYIVWIPNPNIFWYHAYIDPSTWNHYPIWLLRWSFGIYYQVAATLESETALIQWNYFTLAWSDLSGIIKAHDSNSPVIHWDTYLPY